MGPTFQVFSEEPAADLGLELGAAVMTAPVGRAGATRGRRRPQEAQHRDPRSQYFDFIAERVVAEAEPVGEL